MILFSEKQQFRQWWIWVILVLPFGFEIFKTLNEGHPLSLMLHSLGFYFYIPFLLLLLLFSVMTLKTDIKENGIFVQFFPFHLKPKFFPWENILAVYVRKYKPLWEYGGWGIRLSLSKGGKAYNVSGNMGIQLVFKNDQKLLIGTKRPLEVNQVLEQLGRMNEQQTH